MEETKAVPATCTENGRKAYWTCGKCHKTFADREGEKEISDPETIPATSHDWGDWVIVKQPTATKEGEKQRTCKNDPSHVEKEAIPATGEKDPISDNKEKKISGTLLARLTSKGTNKLILTWTKVNGAQGYDIFFSRCSHGNKHKAMKRIKTVKAGAALVWKKKGLKKHTPYKACIKAFVIRNGKKKYVRTSPGIHAYTSGYKGKYTNPKRVKVKKNRISLSVGKTASIKAAVTKLKKGKKLMPKKHDSKIRYISSDTKIATVSKSGRIMAKAKGSCKVYVVAVNGVSKTIKVSVK